MTTLSGAEMRATEPRERLEAFVRDVVARLPLARQRQNALVYARGLIEHGGRKSLQPTLFRLGASAAQYESLQQFLADSPWDAQALWRACAERIVPQIAPLAWVIDDTGFPKDGRHSPGVIRQYSGTLGKVSNCQIGVSLHAVGLQGTLPLGFALYLPEEWTTDPERRRRAKIPAQVAFQTKPELAGALIERAAGWDIPACPVLADQAYGDSAELRTRLDAAGIHYVVAISERTGLYGPDTVFSVPARRASSGRPPERAARRPPPPIGARAGPRPPCRGLPRDRLRHRPGRPDAARALRPPAGLRRQADPARPPAPAPGVAHRRVARGCRAPQRPVAFEPPRRRRARAAGAAGAAALGGGARLPPAQGRARARPLRGPQLPRLASPLRPGHAGARVPHRGAPLPASAAAGLTLPEAVRLLQPMLRCWSGRCQTCRQPVDLDQLVLFPRRE